MSKLSQQAVETMARMRGLKMTPQRRMIVDFLQTAGHHPTADEVLTTVNSRFPMTSRATVYNTLHWLKENRMIREVFEGGSVRFDPNTDPHHHFICRGCGKIEDVEFDLLGKVEVCMMDGKQQVDAYEITLRGLCADCRKN